MHSKRFDPNRRNLLGAAAATGNPNNARTPRWPACTVAQRCTLVFEGGSSHTQAQDDPFKAFREYWAAQH